MHLLEIITFSSNFFLLSIGWAVRLLNDEKRTPNLDMLKNYRGGDMEKFSLWADNFFRAGYGTVQYRSKVTTNKMSELISVYDEAFIVSVVHNAFERWVVEASVVARKGTVNKDDLPATKWTDTGTTAKKYEGWVEAGIEFFNRNITELKKLRKTDASRELEDEYLKNKIEKSEGKRGSSKRITVSITAINGLDDDDEDHEITSGNTEQQKRRRLENVPRVSLHSTKDHSFPYEEDGDDDVPSASNDDIASGDNDDDDDEDEDISYHRERMYKA